MRNRHTDFMVAYNSAGGLKLIQNSSTSAGADACSIGNQARSTMREAGFLSDVQHVSRVPCWSIASKIFTINGERDMSIRWAGPFAASLLLGACGATVESANDDPETVPEAVIALAAPDQDVQTARLRSEDGCYWYQHAGPVETTLLPLRAVDGRPICTASEPPTAS